MKNTPHPVDNFMSKVNFDENMTTNTGINVGKSTKTDLIAKLSRWNKPKSVDNCGYSQVHKPLPVD